MQVFYGTKDKALPKLDDVVYGVEQSIESRKQLRESELAMSIDLIKFVRKEAPPFEKKISFAITPMHKIAKIEEKEEKSESVLREDLNDVLERRKVIKRIENEYSDAVNALEQAKLDYQEAKNNLQYIYDHGMKGKQLEAAEDYYEEAKNARKKCYEDVKEITGVLIVEKNKFSKFISNRIKHGFIQYGNIVSECASDKAELYSQMNTSFSELRKSIDTLASGSAGTLQPMEGGRKKSKTDVFKSVKNPFDDL